MFLCGKLTVLQEPRGTNFGLKSILLLFFVYPLTTIKDLIFETNTLHSPKVPSVGDFSYSIKWLMGSLLCVLQNSFVALSKM
jgi:hypothetical protein